MNVDRPTLTLHEAMVQILSKCADQTAEHVYLASEIRRQTLYWQNDGSAAPSGQIAVRARNYPDLFEKILADQVRGQRAKIRLRYGSDSTGTDVWTRDHCTRELE
ncbi:MAG: hypothetical protein ABFD54_06465 [Armatimonadota bacterium]|nr:hypothetical protein [bacterium]